MSKSFKEPARPWRVVADEISHADRGDRILELAEELERAFEEQTPGRQFSQVTASDGRNEQQIDQQQGKQS